MAPSAKKLEAALLSGTIEVYNLNPDETSVNKVRKHVEEKLGLDDGFFSGAEWKSKSKTLIKRRVEQLLDGWVPPKQEKEEEEEPEPKPSVKRRSSELESPEPKRRKRGPKPKKPAKKEESDFGNSSEEEKPRKKRLSKSRKPKLAESEEDDFHAKTSPSPKAEDQVKEDSDEEKGKEAHKEEKEDMLLEKIEDANEDEKSEIKSVDSVQDEIMVSPIRVREPKPEIDEEDEYSDVIDEPPKPKRAKKEKKEKKERPNKSAKSAKAAPAPKRASISEDPQDSEIKKLQNQLIKCGIRKLWHNELKKYGDDSRAKIRHLKKMLADIGMDGRFSEAKAREIKEMRELQAEAEAAQEMNRLWGMGTEGRASRSKSKTMKAGDSEASEGEAAGGGDDDDDEEDNTFAARRRRAQADLAFLGDDSDSD